MFRRIAAGTGGRRDVRSGCRADATPPPAQPPAGSPRSRRKRLRTSACSRATAGMVLNFIKPDKTADFEAVMAKLKEALQKSDKPERKAAGGELEGVQVARSGAAPTCSTCSSSIPSVKGADYHGLEHPRRGVRHRTEINDSYKQYAEAYASGHEHRQSESGRRSGQVIKRWLVAGQSPATSHRPPVHASVRTSDSVPHRCAALASSARRFPA